MRSPVPSVVTDTTFTRASVQDCGLRNLEDATHANCRPAAVYQSFRRIYTCLQSTGDTERALCSDTGRLVRARRTKQDRHLLKEAAGTALLNSKRVDILSAIVESAGLKRFGKSRDSKYIPIASIITHLVLLSLHLLYCTSVTVYDLPVKAKL